MHLPFFLLPSSVILPITVFFSQILLFCWLSGCASLISLIPSSYSTSFQLFLLPNPINLISTSTPQWVLTLSTFHPNSPSSPAPSNQLSSYSLSPFLTISQNNALTDKYFHALSCVCDNPKMSCLAQPLIQSLNDLLLSSPCAILFAVNQLFCGAKRLNFLFGFLCTTIFTPSYFGITLLLTISHPPAKFLNHLYPFQHSQHIFQLTLLLLSFNIHIRGRKQPAQDKNRAEMQRMAYEVCSF